MSIKDAGSVCALDVRSCPRSRGQGSKIIGQDLQARRQDHGQDLGGKEARSWPRSRGQGRKIMAKIWGQRGKIMAKI